MLADSINTESVSVLLRFSEPDFMLQNIARRGRSYEQEITAEYLNNIQDSYMTYLKQHPNFPILIVEARDLDFVKNPADYQKIKNLLNHEYPAGLTRITF